MARPTENGVWAQNADAVEAFLAVCTQWNVVGLAEGGLLTIGLNYTAASAGLELAGIELDPETWARVRIIEQGAKAAMNGD
ncbi:MAG: DUF1799 domain-containing protein [Paracoccaceae bacterium]